MRKNEIQNLFKRDLKLSARNLLILSLVSIFALVFTFVVASSDNSFNIKLGIFSAIILLFLVTAFFLNFRQPQNILSEDLSGDEEEEEIFNSEVESRLYALEEANKFFGAALKSGDMFRLITSRVNELVPFAACTLFLAENKNTRLRIALSVGENGRALQDLEIPFAKGLAGKAFITGKPQLDPELTEDKKIIPELLLKEFNSSICVPLYRDGEIYGVLELFGDETVEFNENSLVLLEAIGERVAPLILSSFAFEQNISSALTDNLTSFPNERAFYLVLENQIAEAQRYESRRSLTILSIDLKNFNELNEKYGHVTGNKALAFAASLIKEQLRKMDFLARSQSDEFLVVLPTASNEITEDIIGRLERQFAQNPFQISEAIRESLKINFGSATFQKDGETANQMLKNARINKQELKLEGSGKLVQFPNRFVN